MCGLVAWLKPYGRPWLFGNTGVSTVTSPCRDTVSVGASSSAANSGSSTTYTGLAAANRESKCCGRCQTNDQRRCEKQTMAPAPSDRPSIEMAARLGIDVASDAGMNFLLDKGAIVERTSLMIAPRR